MAEYIEREALLKSILELPPKMVEQGYGWLGRRGVWQMVSDFPAADVRPVVRGKWIIPTRVPDSMLDECSVCGFDTGAYTFNFCPNCGADMREES